MKKAFAKKAMLALLALALLSASAWAEPNLAGVRAIPNQKLSFRTGPSTAYGEIDTLPQSTPIVAIELEEGNGVTWVLVEFEYYGSRMRAYTGLKRMALTGYIPYASHDWLSRTLLFDSAVYAAPDLNAAQRAELRAGTTVTFLGFEGSYCFIEYRAGGELNRGYVREEDFMVDLGEFAEDFPDNDGDTFYSINAYSPMYASPSERSEVLFDVPFDASVTVLFSEFDSTPSDWLSIYYGGLHGYGRYDDFCDLRFSSPEQAHEILGLMGR
ncbi:MAG: hypothetical protein IJ048_08545 [Clostridia bacterium]|nr:hypothetical protein [Clostridia bacterium]